jgi:hypothetical protein
MYRGVPNALNVLLPCLVGESCHDLAARLGIPKGVDEAKVVVESDVNSPILPGVLVPGVIQHAHPHGILHCLRNRLASGVRGERLLPPAVRLPS